MIAISTLSVFATVFLLVISVTSRPRNSALQRLQALRRAQPGGVVEETLLQEEERQSALNRLAVSFGRLLPKKLLSGVEAQLVQSGESMTLSAFLTLLFLSVMGTTVIAVLLVTVAFGGFGITQLGLAAMFIGVGFYLPFVIVRSRVNRRKTTIIRSLPDAFDLITTCVEAGLGLDAALARVAEKVEGPFADELSKVLRDVSLGKSRKDALRELGERTGVPDLISFVTAVIQAEQMGSSIGQVLRVQSDQLRVRRRQRAEEQAYKAPVKMIFPLVLFIFPTLFLVILGPAIITIMTEFNPNK